MAFRHDIKRSIFPVTILFMAAVILTACASQGTVTERPATTLVGLTLAKEVIRQGDKAVPQQVGSTFQKTDKAVAALISFQNLYGIIDLRWDWFGPDKRLYLSKKAQVIRTEESKYFKEFSAWHELTIAGDKAEKMPGDWNVNVYMNDTFLLSRSFTILE